MEITVNLKMQDIFKMEELKQLLIISVGSNRKCRETIDSIYKENESRYYEAYVKSDLFGASIKNFFTTKSEEAINKLTGIIEVSFHQNDFNKILKIIRAISPSICNFVKTAPEVNFLTYINKYLKDKEYEMSETEILTHFVSILFLSTCVYKKNIVNSSDILKHIIKWKYNFKSMEDFYDERDMLKFNGNDITERVADLYSMFNLAPFEEVKEDNLGVFYENFIENTVRAKVKNITGINLNEEYVPNVEDIYNKIRNSIFEEGICKYIGSFSRLYKMLGIEDMEASNEVPFGTQELNMILKDYAIARVENNISESERDLYVIASLFIYNLAYLYKEAKDLYLNKSKEEKYKDLKKIEQDIAKKEEIFTKESTKLINSKKEKDIEILKLKETIKNLQKEARLQNKQIDNLKAELTDVKSKYEDVLSENDMLINILPMKQEISQNDVSRNEMIEYINKFNISIFGGNKTQEILSKELINTTFYTELNRNISSIKDNDMIFVYINFFSHAFSKKINSFNKYNKPIRAIDSSNTELVIKYIYDCLKKAYA